MKKQKFRFILIILGIIHVLPLYGILVIALSEKPSFMIFLFLIPFFQINIHELGHAFFAKCFGLGFRSYAVGPFTLFKKDGKLKFALAKRNWLSGEYIVINHKRLAGYRGVLFYSGGLLFESICIFLLLWILFNLPATPYVKVFLIFTVVCLAASVMTNIIPFIAKGAFSDGSNIWGLITKNPVQIKTEEIHNIITQYIEGVRPRDLALWSDSDHWGEADDIAYYNNFLTLYHYFAALDRNDKAKMLLYAEHMEEKLKHYQTILMTPVQYELCFIACVTHKQKESRRYYKRIKKKLKKDSDTNGCRIKAYYEFYVNNDSNLANHYCKLGLENAEAFPIKGQAKMEKDLILNLVERMQNCSSA